MFQKILKISIVFLLIASCSKDKDIAYKENTQINPFTLYEEAYRAFEKADFFFKTSTVKSKLILPK